MTKADVEIARAPEAFACLAFFTYYIMVSYGENNTQSKKLLSQFNPCLQITHKSTPHPRHNFMIAKPPNRHLFLPLSTPPSDARGSR